MSRGATTKEELDGSCGLVLLLRLPVPERWGGSVSLTGADHLFAGVHENGANDLLRAFFLARPHYLHYGSPPFVVATTVNETLMAPIPFPGTGGGIGWLVQFSIPAVDFHPDSSGGALPPPLTLGPGQLSVRTRVRLCVQCGKRRKGDVQGGRGTKDPAGNTGASFTPLCTVLDLWAIGEPVARYFSPGVGDVAFHLDAVEIVDVKPDSLESVLECMIRMMLQAALDQVRLPFHGLTAGAFAIALTNGPEISDDTLKIWGTV